MTEAKMKKKILMIDDEVDFCYFAKRNLERTGELEVVVEVNARRAVEAAIAQKPDLILLDIIMPELDGSEVAFCLASDERTKDIPVVFLTCLAEEKKLTECDGVKLIGGRRFVSKPCETSELVAIIKEVLEKKPK
jgi:CheY-like chemotaxis protein